MHGPLAERARELTGKYDRFRSAIVNEPRGSSVLVGALPTPPVDPTCAVGVIFFTHVGALGMCGHGTIGLMVTLAWLERLGIGEHRIETPVGIVRARLHDANTVSVSNVPAYRLERHVKVNVEGHGPVTGDIAWGGNWFFLVEDHGQRLAIEHADDLLAFCKRVKRALEREAITGANGAEIDHVELFEASPRQDADSRNFVLCPGGSYDRSPCGTGTSAKLACLQADGKLRPGQTWRQESITGSVFEASYAMEGERVLPTLKGTAWVNGEATLILDPDDPHCWGIRPA